MANVTIKLVNINKMGDFYFSKDKEALARTLLTTGMYEVAASFDSDAEGEKAAEEAFDLTNNPSRQSERMQIVGRQRSVSVGDVVAVDGVNYLCASMGWKAL